MTIEVEMADEARAILDSVQPSLPGMEAESKVTILGTTVSTNQQFVLGQAVDFHIRGYVTECGDALVANEGQRRIIKVKSTLIEIVSMEDAPPSEG